MLNLTTKQQISCYQSQVNELSKDQMTSYGEYVAIVEMSSQ